jgi:hypothetical protein
MSVFIGPFYDEERRNVTHPKTPLTAYKYQRLDRLSISLYLCKEEI